MLDEELQQLSRGFELWIDDDSHFVILGGVKLRPGYNAPETQLLIEIPQDYPVSPPGIGASRVYVPATLNYRGRRLRQVHEQQRPNFETPGFGPWAWWCYCQIAWDPTRDDLTKFVEMVRADLSNPQIF
jgi:hypothetical protein